MNTLLAPRRIVASFLCVAALTACLTTGTQAEAAPPVTVFESGQVRPLALSSDGKLLFAVNTRQTTASKSSGSERLA
jgi:ABC-type uncharacterized transport system auxiliary subunit